MRLVRFSFSIALGRLRRYGSDEMGLEALQTRAHASETIGLLTAISIMYNFAAPGMKQRPRNDGEFKPLLRTFSELPSPQASTYTLFGRWHEHLVLYGRLTSTCII